VCDKVMVTGSRHRSSVRPIRGRGEPPAGQVASRKVLSGGCFRAHLPGSAPQSRQRCAAWARAPRWASSPQICNGVGHHLRRPHPPRFATMKTLKSSAVPRARLVFIAIALGSSPPLTVSEEGTMLLQALFTTLRWVTALRARAPLWDAQRGGKESSRPSRRTRERRDGSAQRRRRARVCKQRGGAPQWGGRRRKRPAGAARAARARGVAGAAGAGSGRARARSGPHRVVRTSLNPNP
jgi:hypothetical protein